MKKIAFISPKGNVFGRNVHMNKFLTSSRYMESFKALWTAPNLGLITMAALTPTEWECEYIDENYRTINYDKEYDIVCISAMTQQALNAYKISDTFRKKGALTVMGGIHPTLLADEAAEHADVIVEGEGEMLWPIFIKDYISGNVKKRYQESSPGSFPLRDGPIPRYELLLGYDYPIITLQTTRGCPHNCSFCAASKVYGRKYRRKDNQQILQEISQIAALFPGALILFADDNAFVKRAESKRLLKNMINLDIRWIAQTDISIAEDEELLELMVLAGCQWVVIGFESVVSESLDGLDETNWKMKKKSSYKEYIEIISKVGIGVYGTFIVGLDNDDKTVFERTADFIVNSLLYGSNITVPTPLPGTQLREELLNQQRVLTNDWSYYTFWDVTIKPQNMSVEELEIGLHDVYHRITQSAYAESRLIHLREMVKRKNRIKKKYFSSGDIYEQN